MFNSKKDLIVIIPAYEPPVEFIEYAREVSGMAKRLIVVNDGSGTEFDSIFCEISEIENVIYISYPENHGKGYALKTAFSYCGEHFSPTDIVVTADCDGQHKAADIMRVYKAAFTHPKALTLGSRDFTLPNVPKRSIAGNSNMRWMFRTFYGGRVYDTQTGLRGFTVEMAQRFLKIRGNRFEYELGMLIFAKKNTIDILETPIETVYPEDPEDHVSHFRTITDSLRVLGVMLGNLNFYILSSALSGVLDVLVFFLMCRFVVTGGVTFDDVLVATVTARVASSVLNFFFNCKYVFGGATRRSIVKYYLLWTCQLSISYGLTSVFNGIISSNANLTAVAADLLLTTAKMVIDLTLAVLSYQIQQHWVFKGKDPKKFYGPLLSNVRSVARTFSRSYRCNVLPYDEGVVYVARHLNLHGPFATLKWLEFHVHPMVFSPFFTRKECYRQYADYTFTKRAGKKKKKVNLKAYMASRVVPSLVKSVQAVPVYRSSIDSIKTFRRSMDYLMKSQSLIVYPDIEYTCDGSGVSDIYDGFLYLGELYKRRTGKSLKFVPIFISEERKSLNEGDFITVDSFKEGRAAAAEYLKNAINGIQTPIPEEVSL